MGFLLSLAWMESMAAMWRMPVSVSVSIENLNATRHDPALLAELMKSAEILDFPASRIVRGKVG